MKKIEAMKALLGDAEAIQDKMAGDVNDRYRDKLSTIVEPPFNRFFYLLPDHTLPQQRQFNHDTRAQLFHHMIKNHNSVNASDLPPKEEAEEKSDEEEEGGDMDESFDLKKELASLSESQLAELGADGGKLQEYVSSLQSLETEKVIYYVVLGPIFN